MRWPDAKRSAALHDLHLLTEAIERYRIHHEGVPPDNLSGNTLPQLTNQTDIVGNVGSGAAYPHGPYLVGEIPEAGYAVGTSTGYSSSGYVFQIYQIQGTGIGPRNTEREVEVQVELGPVEQ